MANFMPETTAVVAVAGDYIFPNSSTEYLSAEMLYLMTNEQLKLARNEIYARHGRMFSNPDLQQYFMSKAWYVPLYEPAVFDAMGHSMMNEFEIHL